MKFPRSSRLAVAYVALVCMLFIQLAAVAYACPVTAMGSESSSVSMSHGAEQMVKTGCDGMDMEQPTFCHTHAFGEAAKQSLDKSELPPVQPFVPAGLVMALHVVDIASAPTVTPHTSILLTRTTAPPIAIRHCCFRI